MNELLKAIEELKRAYKASGVKYLHIEVADDGHIDLVEIVNGEGRVAMDTEFTETQDKPLTNGEWLRGLSDEELAIFLVRGCVHQYEPTKMPKDCEERTCYSCVDDWLRAEHKE